MKPTLPLLVAVLSAALFVPVQAQDGPPHDGPPGKEHGGPHRGPGFGGGPRRGPGGPMRSKGRLMHLWHGIGELNGKNAISKTQAQRIVALVLPVSKKMTLSDADAKTLSDKLEAVLTDPQKSEVFSHGPGRPGGPPPGRGHDGGDRFSGGRDGGRDDEDGHRGGPPRGRMGEPDHERPDGPPPGGDRPGGPRGERSDGPGGDHGGGDRDGGNRPDREKMRAWMQKFNPFYAPTGYGEWKSWPKPMQQDMAHRYHDNRATLETLSKLARSKK